MNTAAVLPAGYRSVVTFDRETHAGLGVDEAARYRAAAGLNAIYLTAVEFFQACHDYPVVFVHEGGDGPVVPMAVTGLQQGRNLFVDARAGWREWAYVPAWCRRYPFITTEVRLDDSGEMARVICVDEGCLSADAEPLFDAEGRSTSAWERIESLINDFEMAVQQTRRLCELLQQHALLEPFQAQVHPRHDEPMTLQGMFRVKEEALNELPSRVLKDFMRRGELSRIYAHLISLENFAALLDLQARAGQPG